MTLTSILDETEDACLSTVAKVGSLVTKENQSTSCNSCLRVDLRRAQVEGHLDPKKRAAIARSFIEARLERPSQVLDWLGESHDIEQDIRSFREEAHGLGHAKTMDEIRSVEARAAETYWRAFQKAVPSKLEFKSRSTRARNRQYNASDPVNADCGAFEFILLAE